MIRLTREDILQTKLVEKPDWYLCNVDEYKKEAAKKDQSTNHVYYCKIAEGSEKGVGCRCSFSEKFLGPIKGFFEACGEDVSEDGGNFNEEFFVGKQLYIHIEPKENPNDKKIYNTPTGFMSIANYNAAFSNQEVNA